MTVWTCPDCGRTVAIDATDADVRCCIEAAQHRHRRGHAAARKVLERLGLPDPPTRRRARPC